MRSRIKPNPFILVLALLALASFVSACGPGAQPAVPTVASIPAGDAPTAPPADTGSQEPYPAPVAVATTNPYPAEGEAAVPATAVPEAYPPAEETFLEPRFRFDQPVAAGATTITGQAPPGLALAVLDVTYNGALLGTGRSDDSGRFTIPVSGLVAGNRIGIAIGELAEGQTLNQMVEQYYPYRGEGFMNLPNVGIFFDTVQVQP
jgi:hypothetical protein